MGSHQRAVASPAVVQAATVIVCWAIREPRAASREARRARPGLNASRTIGLFGPLLQRCHGKVDLLAFLDIEARNRAALEFDGELHREAAVVLLEPILVGLVAPELLRGIWVGRGKDLLFLRPGRLRLHLVELENLPE